MNIRYTNNFDILRFLAASSIIISHCYALSLGYPNLHFFDWHLLLGQAGLATLLVISGYLITRSWEQRPVVRNFLWKRVLRIVPGLILSVSFIILIIGPLNTSFTISEYFAGLTSFSTWSAVPFYNNGGAIGIFAGNPVTYVNAPLWTIPLEFVLYISVVVLGVIGLMNKRFIMLPFILITVLTWISVYDNPALNKIRFIIYFFAGSFLYLNRDYIGYRWWIAVLLFVPVLLASGTQYMFLFAFIAIPYFVLTVAYAGIPYLSNFGKYGEPSYGMYIYAYPIQQTILHFLPGILIEEFIILSLGCAIPLAYLSWHLIEKKALLLKNINLSPGSKTKTEIV